MASLGMFGFSSDSQRLGFYIMQPHFLLVIGFLLHKISYPEATNIDVCLNKQKRFSQSKIWRNNDSVLQFDKLYLIFPPMLVLYIHFYDLILIKKLKHGHKWESILNYESILLCRIVHCMLHCTIFIILLWVSDKLVCLRMIDVCDEKEKAFENLVKNTFAKFLNVFLCSC